MKKFTFSFLLLTICTSLLIAEEQKEPSIIKAPKEIALQIIEEEENSSSQCISKSLKEDLNPLWYHQLAEVKNSGYQIELNDGTIWELGWWWHFRVTGWEEGDTVLLSMNSPNSSNYMKIKNLTRNSTAWGALFSIPQPNSETLWIQSISDHFSQIELCNGCRLRSEKINIFRYWKEEDIVFTILYPSKFNSEYAIWNFSAGEIVFNLEVEN